MDWRPPRLVRNLEDRITGFQVLGERSSGTNFVTQLLSRNFDGVPRNPAYGWKHGFIDRRVAATDGLLTVLVYRHPLRWLQSIHARPLDLSRSMHGLGFAAFIRHEWQGAFQREDGTEEPSTADMEPKARVNFANAMRLRAAKIGYFEEMAEMPARIAYLRYEDANRDPRRTLNALAEGFGIPLGPYAPVETFKGITRSPYVPKQMPRIAPGDLAFIRQELDLGLERRIGYDLADVPRFDGLPGWDPRSLRSLLRAVRPR
ncbi:hypothetical protein HMH01_02195 [Halovulum dunhuangense]|uniref:Sulfotransferase family protein n=1 Tax=Halovulum dunhuangense TaxID=1505036 RepID=A0A849KQU8_9RHOB|nr:hypothetical protein [Halovulum dunhuangense]NNU79239.1 hypothetical protein [Halovulum dunhuangense]